MSADSPSWSQVIAWHVLQRPYFAPVDLYKLIYQSTYGPEHLVTDRSQTLSYLEREVDGLEPSDDDLVLEPISPGSSIVRVNMRPFLYRFRDGLPQLADSFCRSAQLVTGNPVLLSRRWLTALGHLAKTRPEFISNADQLWTELRRYNYPPVHHSELYRQRYRPAYRVIAASCLEDSWKNN